MKKALIVIAVIFGLLLVAAIILPIIFKDDIRAAIDRELDKNLNAKVYYDPDAFSVSLIRNFPNISVTVDDFGVAGVGVFEGDTLADIKSFRLTLDIISVIRGEQIKIVNVSLDQPTINVVVLEDGTANYDIVKATEEMPEDTTESEPVNVQIKGWEISNGMLIYNDQTLPMIVLVEGLDHSGSGDFSQDIFDMETETEISGFSLAYDGVEYISNKQVNADITMEMNLADMKFTFKENEVLLNNFGFGFDGFVSMPADDIDLDITFGGHDVTLASIISLIPGVYQDYLEGIDASGEISFEGYVRGTYNENSMPAVASTFVVNDGRIAYAEYPVPMENIQVSAAFDYPSADLTQTSFKMDRFSMTMDGEEVTAALLFENLENYTWDFRLNGNLDLDKITKVVPLEEDMALRGKVSANLATKGRMSDLEAERYDQLPTSGSLTMNDFFFQSADLPQGFEISETEMTFNPNEIALTTFAGKTGNTDLNMSGSITNYMQYALDDSATVYGTLDFYAALLDVNELMGEPAEEEETADTTAMEIVRIPENVDFVLTSKIDEIRYDNLSLNDFAGKVVVRNGALILDNTGFNLLDGQFSMSGSYASAAALAQPLYDFDFSIDNLSIPEAFKSFTTVQKWVPVAEKMSGNFSTDFTIGGSIGEGMEPVYEDMQGAGLIEISQAAVTDLKILELISSISKLNQSDGDLTLQNIQLSAEITNGRLYVEPFDITVAGRTATISGSTGVDGTIDYAMAMEVPSGQVGQALNSAIASVAGVDDLIGKNVTLNIGIAGTYDDPSVKLLGAQPGSSGTVGGTLKAKAKEELKEKKEELRKEVEQKKDSAVNVVRQRAEEKKEEVKEEVDKQVEEKKEELKNKAQDALKDVFGRKKKGGG